MKKLKPDIIARIHFYDSTKKKKIKGQYNCPICFEDIFFEGCLLLDKATKSSSDNVLDNIPIKFLYRDKVEVYLKIGVQFKIWEMGFIGEGEIVDVLV